MYHKLILFVSMSALSAVGMVISAAAPVRTQSAGSCCAECPLCTADCCSGGNCTEACACSCCGSAAKSLSCTKEGCRSASAECCVKKSAGLDGRLESVLQLADATRPANVASSCCDVCPLCAAGCVCDACDCACCAAK